MLEFIIDKPHPLEIDCKGRTPLSYHISYNNINKDTVPIIVLHGFGEVSHSTYMESLHKSLSSKYNTLIITINYNGTFIMARSYNVKPIHKTIRSVINIKNLENKEIILHVIKAILKNPDYMTEELIKNDYLFSNANLKYHLKILEQLKEKIKLDECDGRYVIERLNEIGFKKSLVEFKEELYGEHQDFGLIQAVDVLTVIADIKQNKELNFINWDKLSIVGSSHGAYIASMCDKLAPNTFNKIVNNSGWVFPNTNIYDFKCTIKYLKTECEITITNYWSDKKTSRNYFSTRHNQIRALHFIDHMLEQKKQTIKQENKRYYFIHTINDNLIPVQEKDNYISGLIDYNFANINYIRLDDKSKLDGKTLKTLDHAANASLKGLVIDYIINDKFDSIVEKNDFDLKSTIVYKCLGGSYKIKFDGKYPIITFGKYKEEY